MDVKIDLEWIVSIDDFMGILNCWVFMEWVIVEVQCFCCVKQIFMIVVIDIDKFKQINDWYGYVVGDMVLKKFVDIIVGGLRMVDVFGCVGGEEFCLLFYNIEVKGVMVVCERLWW